ncbi:MAG: alpha/beta hydrolase [Chloroflexi bacterium]|nr:alpha/beta hydrolase [Chloroflexota bacterium]MYK36021.1 alpha/beta hydrolase [Chloroflexota bacterium]
MPLDPEAKASLEKRIEMGVLEPHESSPEEARALQAARPNLPGPEMASVSDHLAPGPHGDVPVRVYVPVTDDAGPLPVSMWFHGGGWVIGSVESNDATARALAKASGAIIVSVDYRLAPEHRFPIPFDDSYAATVWTAENAASLGGDPSRLAVAGASAGGNLSTTIALRARDENGPRLVHQSLIYPVTDRDFTRPSYKENGEGYGLSYASMVWFFDCYLSSEADASNPYVAPILAEDLSGLPPAFVLTCEYDPLRDEGEAYAKRLQEAGVPTRLSRYDGMIHAFYNAGIPFSRTWDAINETAGEMQKAFGTA